MHPDSNSTITTGGPRSRHQPEFSADIALLATAGIWSSAFIVSKDQLDVFSPLSFIFARFLPMLGLAWLLAVVLHGEGDRTPNRDDVLRFAAAGLTGFTINNLCFTLGIDRTSAFSSALLVSTSPLFTLIILAAIGERPPAIAWCGSFVAIAGVALFVFDKESGGHSTTGDLLSLGAAAAFAAYGIIMRPFSGAYTATRSSAWVMTFGIPPLLLLSIPDARDQDWSAVASSSWLAMGFMVVFPIYVAFMLWNYGIVRRGAVIATSFGLLVPVVSGVLSAIIFNEQFGALKLAGAGLVLAGLLTIRVGAMRANGNGQLAMGNGSQSSGRRPRAIFGGLRSAARGLRSG